MLSAEQRKKIQIRAKSRASEHTTVSCSGMSKKIINKKNLSNNTSLSRARESSGDVTSTPSAFLHDHRNEALESRMRRRTGRALSCQQGIIECWRKRKDRRQWNENQTFFVHCFNCAHVIFCYLFRFGRVLLVDLCLLGIFYDIWPIGRCNR